MAKFSLYTNHAEARVSGMISILFKLDGTPDPFPARVIEAANVKELEAALSAYEAEAAATGKPLAVSVRLIDGRAPNGFKAWKAARPSYVPFNLE